MKRMDGKRWQNLDIGFCNRVFLEKPSPLPPKAKAMIWQKLFSAVLNEAPMKCIGSMSKCDWRHSWQSILLEAVPRKPRNKFPRNWWKKSSTFFIMKKQSLYFCACPWPSSYKKLGVCPFQTFVEWSLFMYFHPFIHILSSPVVEIAKYKKWSMFSNNVNKFQTYPNLSHLQNISFHRDLLQPDNIFKFTSVILSRHSYFILCSAYFKSSLVAFAV